MKHNLLKRAAALLLALVCVVGVLPPPVFAAGGLSAAPAAITQKSADFLTINGQMVCYQTASSVINSDGWPHVFNAQVEVPGYGTTRALCAMHKGTLGDVANGQQWTYKKEAVSSSLNAILTYVYSHAYGSFTAAGQAAALEHWSEYWSNIWFLVAQSLTWYYEYGILLDVDADREAFIEQAAGEFVVAMKLFHQSYGRPWITDWDDIDIHTIIDSADGGVTGNSAYAYVAAGVNLVLDHPEYFHTYHLWIYEWDDSQPWLATGDTRVMQDLLVAIADTDYDEPVSLTVKKLAAGTNEPIPGVVFTVESADGSGDFSVTRATGDDGTFTLTSETDGLSAGQYRITETAAPEGYLPLTASQLVTILPGSAAGSAVTFYNEEITGEGTIRKVDSDNPTVGIPGAVIRISSVKLDNGGSFTGTYATGDGGYISREDLDFKSLPTGSYVAEEITPPEGYILSSDVSKVKQTFVWDGKNDVSLVFENSSKVKVQLQKMDESGKPLAGAIFIVLRDGQIIETKETDADGTITVSNISEGYYEFREVFAPAGYDCDRSPVGVYVNAEDLQGEQTITVTKTNYHKRSLTIEKKDAGTGAPVAGTIFHVRGVNVAYENDVTTGANGTVTLTKLPSGCYEIEETNVPAPYILDANNCKTVWIDAETGQDVTVTFFNSTKPGLIIRKIDAQTGEPLSNVLFKVEEVNGGYSAQHFTDANGMILLNSLTPGAYTVTEIKPKDGYVGDDTVRTVYLEENKTTTIELSNLRKPDLLIQKVDSITGGPIAGVKFQIWRASDNTKSGEYNDLGIYYTDANGEIHLERVDTGWYKILELEPAPGYAIKDPASQDVYLKAGESRTVVFENTPLSALIVWKYDSVTGKAIDGAVFQVRYLGGASGTGGAVIGTYKTSVNGSFTVTGLKAGTYIIEELASDSSHVIDAAPQTVYISGKEQDVVQLYFGNSPKGSLLVKKIDSVTHEPLSDVEFFVTASDGAVVGNANGKYVTDSAGAFLIDGLDPGVTLVVRETRARDGYLLDDAPQTVRIKAGETVTLEFRNQPKGNLIVEKRDSVTGKPLEGVEFELRYADGSYVDNGSLSSLGRYYTDKNGQIIISGLIGTVVVTEVKTIPGYVIHEETRSQTVQVNANDTQKLIFYNDPIGGLELIKVSEGDTTRRIPGVTFEIRRMDGGLVTTVTTGSTGRVYVDLDAGNYYAMEIETARGFQLDSTPHYFTVTDGKTTTLTVKNKPLSGILIHKTDSVTGQGLYGVTFLLYDSTYTPIGQYTSDDQGFVYIEGLTDGGRYYLRELENAGYVPDTQLKTVYVQAGETTLIEWQNTPITGQIQIIKTSADYNSVNGWPAGTPIPNTEFEIYDYRTGNLMETVRTDKNGVAVSRPLPLGRYRIVESKAADFYVLDKTPIEVELEYAGQIVKASMTNNSLYTNVSIQKTGYYEVMAGQNIRYTFSGIGNNSNIPLTSFYWRDALPVEAVRLAKITTGTYNAPGSYKVVYKTNLSGGEYRTMYDNLSTAVNYTLDASPVTLGLASNEYVTEFMLVFGAVPAGFRQVEVPKVDCTVLSTVRGGSQFTNTADVGGVYNGQWVQAVSRWVTIIYTKSSTLPRTGY